MQPSSPSISQSIGGALRDLRVSLRRLLPLRRFGHPRPPQRSRRSPDELVIGTIADPELDMYLLSVRGTVTIAQIWTLAAALRSFDDGTILHLDLTDAEFPDPAAFAEFEALVDSLEDRSVRIRIVGLRPPVPSQPD